MRVFTTFEELEAAAGDELGTSEWVTIDQRRVNLFADATGDHQWIHVDVERADGRAVRRHDRARLPDARAHPVARQPGVQAGDPRRQAQLRHQQGPLPVPAAGRLPHPCAPDHHQRHRLPKGKQLTVQHTIEIEGQDKPACVAETVVLAAQLKGPSVSSLPDGDSFPSDPVARPRSLQAGGKQERRSSATLPAASP